MLRGLLNHVPTVVLVVTVLVLAFGGVVLAVWLIRRFVPATREEFNSEIVAAMLGVLAALFGLLLAFVVVIEYQNFLDAKGNVDTEADSLAAIVRDSHAFPEPGGARIRRAVGVYDRAVVEDEWPRLRNGKSSSKASAALDGIYVAFRQARLPSHQARSFYDDSVHQLNVALEARRNRLGDSTGGLPPDISALIIVGSIAIIGYATLVGSRSFWFHAIGAGLIAVVVTFSLIVLVDLNYPFSGDVGIDPGPFEQGVLAQFKS